MTGWLAFGTEVRELRRDGSVVVGSGADADWRVSSADLMPRHFVVSAGDEGATVRASSLDNVVTLNGTQIGAEPTPISDGDVILAGNGRFPFTVAAPAGVSAEEAGSAAAAYLVDDQTHIAHRLMNRSTPIGRDASNAVLVREPTASRFHAEVKREAGGFALHSMGATGTTLNGEVVRKPTMLREGDQVEVAFLRLRFTQENPSGAVVIAPPHSILNDEATRKPTLGSVRAVGADDPALPLANAGDRRGSRAQLWVVVLLLVGAGIWWLSR